MFDVIVIGAGQAGLAAAHVLQQTNASATLRGVSHDARRVVGRITRLLEKPVSLRNRLNDSRRGAGYCCR